MQNNQTIKEAIEKAIKEKIKESLFSSAISHFKNKRYVEAITDFEKAGKLGHGQSLFELGTIYREGIGNIQPNHKKAKHYFQQSAKAGCNDANAGLAFCNISERFKGSKIHIAKKYFDTYFKNANTQSTLFKQSRKAYTQISAEISFRLNSAQQKLETLKEKVDKKLPSTHEDGMEVFYNVRSLIGVIKNSEQTSEENKKAHDLLLEYMPYLISILGIWLNTAKEPTNFQATYNAATDFATGIKNFDPAHYKKFQDALCNIRTATWEKLPFELKEEIIQKQNEDKQTASSSTYPKR